MRWHLPRVALSGENTVPWNGSWWLAEGMDDPKKLNCEAWRMAFSLESGNGLTYLGAAAYM